MIRSKLAFQDPRITKDAIHLSHDGRTHRDEESVCMATILHLTDLHLAQPSKATALGDYSKAQLLEPAEFQSRKTALEASIESLGQYLTSSKRTLDSIVVTGDITVAADPDGYELLEPFLNRLGAAMVAPERVLIAPGNHDVRWSTLPGSVERYESLLELRRTSGYRTAYLDGIDIDKAGLAHPGSTEPLITASDASYVVVALNSSNHCGVDAAVEEGLEGELADLESRAEQDPALARLLRAWRRRGLSDLARLDYPQLLAVGNLWNDTPSTDVAAPLRIAALHHQIGPVTDIEEVKTFETMSNLGAFRKWLADYQVDVVLHGHTHVAFNRHDAQRPYDAPLTARTEHRFLVIGGGTIERGAPRAPIANLITTEPAAPRLRPVLVSGLRATLSKKPLKDDDFITDKAFVRGDEQHVAGVVAGRNVDEVFEQLLGLGDLSGCVRPLVCRLDDGSSALRLPASYPDNPFESDLAEQWLADTVAWWQRAPRGAGAPFNHGERLKHRDGEELDQIERAAKALAKDTTSSRGVAVLVHPRTDLQEDSAFPSFVMLHATVVSTSASSRLDLVAYFRKQEIPHWWPINMAELATIQNTMLDIMAANSRPGVHPGSLTSVTSIPVAGTGIPFVSVPWLDRIADDPGELLTLVTPLLLADDSVAQRVWSLAMADWAIGDRPPADGEPVPLEGINALAAIIHALADAFGSSRRATVAVLEKSLRALSLENDSYRSALKGKDRATARAKWIKAVNDERENIRDAIATLTA